MGIGARAAFVISWSQTETDGQLSASPHSLEVGSCWRWTGKATRIDTPGDRLLLTDAKGSAETKLRASRMARRLIGALTGESTDPALGSAERLSQAFGIRAAVPGVLNPHKSFDIGADLPDQSLILTDGQQSYLATLLDVSGSTPPLVLFTDRMPPPNRDLWVLIMRFDAKCAKSPDHTRPQSMGKNVICFTPGTLIETASGPRAVESLRPGDQIQTRDNGPQEILWTGARSLSGAQLHQMAHLRPIRIKRGALKPVLSDQSQGKTDLLVSPGHKMLLRGPGAMALFNTSEVLVAAADLLAIPGVHTDMSLPQVQYHHLLLPSHEIIFANGIETESFHPAAADLSALDARDRHSLTAIQPEIAKDPMCYGDFARRCLTEPEAAILTREYAA